MTFFITFNCIRNIFLDLRIINMFFDIHFNNSPFVESIT
nr:MAG TPA: hypothetical protein [Caudoviricetes sp.]